MIVIVYYFSKHNITIGTVVGIGVALYVYYNIGQVIRNENEIYTQNKKVKLNTIRPRTEFIKDNDDVIDFLFSIQDLYYHNPQTYIEMVKSIDDFFRIYAEMHIKQYYNGAEYETLVMKKRDALNVLAYIGANLQSSKILDNKMIKALERLEDILNEKIENVRREHKEYIYKHGYNNKMNILHTGPLPKNTYDNILEPNIRFDNELF